MTTISVFLMIQIRTKNQESQVFDRESFTITFILFCFGISFLIRWLWDSFFRESLDEKSHFEYLLVSDLVVIFLSDGLTQLALLVFHHINFKVPKEQQISN